MVLGRHLIVGPLGTELLKRPACSKWRVSTQSYSRDCAGRDPRYFVKVDTLDPSGVQVCLHGRQWFLVIALALFAAHIAGVRR